MLNLRLLFASALWLCSALPYSGVQAQTVWRCDAGSEGGKRYSDTPCTGGKALDVADPRSAADVRSAQDSVKRTQALADRMRQQRLQDEHRNLMANAVAANVGPTRAVPLRASKADEVKSKKRRQTPQTSQALQRAQKPQRLQSPSVAEDFGTWREAAVPFRQRRD